MTEFLLSVRITASQPNQTDETLAIDAEGGVWFWLLAGAVPERRDRCGTFALEADAKTASTAKRIATALGKLPPVTETLARGQLALVLEAGGKSHTLAAFGKEKRSAEISEALDLIDQLRSQALAKPRAALQITLRSQVVATGQAAPALFQVASIGSDPITVLFDEKSFAIFGFDQSGTTLTWHALEGDTIGLLDSSSLDLRDGVLVPASLEPGSQSLASFDNALQAKPGNYTLTGSVSGKLLLLRPGEPTAPMPNRRFDLTTAQIPWQAQ